MSTKNIEVIVGVKSSSSTWGGHAMTIYPQVRKL